MHNPWIDLPPRKPFLLPCDEQSIRQFNHQAKQEHSIHCELLPEPYLGNPQAKVLLLNLNPGYDPNDIDFHQGHPSFIEANRANLNHEQQDYPLYMLDPRFDQYPGSAWWRGKLRPLIHRYGAKKVANDLCVVEYFPYHSKRFGFNTFVASQTYSLFLVEEAMKRGALIIQMRSKRIWQKSVPLLAHYREYYVLTNPQNPAISEGNCPHGYPEIVKRLNVE